MADKKATLLIQLKDQASAGISKLTGLVGGLAGGFLGVTSAVAALTAGIYASLSAYSEQENAIAKLNIALKNQGITSATVSLELQKYASELQQVTTVGDETSMEMMALLTTFGLTGDKMKEVYASAIDLSRGLRIDLHTAVLMMGKAAAGETGTLSRYGIIIDESASKSQKLAEVLKQVNSRFAGSATAEMSTYSGQVIALKNAFGDLLENMGALLIGPAGKVVGWLKDMTNWLREHTSGLQKNNAAENENIANLRKRLEWTQKDIEATKEKIRLAASYDEGAIKKQVLKEQTDIMRALANAKKLYNAELEKEIALEMSRATVKGPTGENEELKKLRQQADERIQTYQYSADEIARIKDNELAYKLQAQGDYDTASRILDASYNQSVEQAAAKRKTDYLAENQQKLSFASQFFGNIASLSRSSNKELAVIGKAGAIAQATVDTYAGATKALATIPPPFGFAVAGSIIAAGMANVAQIAATPIALAKGGIVMPSNGGTIAQIGEAGRAEAVIPLDDPETQEKLSGVMGGANITIQAGVIVADRYSVEQFARQIDEELFKLGRNRQSYNG